MRERGIIFNAEMVRAILDGRKTQTRRIMKLQPKPSTTRPGDHSFASKKLETMIHVSDLMPGNCAIADSHLFYLEHCCPFGKPGDRLWVRETHRVHGRATDVATLAYRASERQSWTQQTHRVPVALCDKPVSAEKWTPSIHMPRWASRITLEITGVRVERLNSISHDDAYAEGIHSEVWDQTVVARNYLEEDSFFQFWSADMPDYIEDMSELYRESFKSLWQSIYGTDSWQANPWVWVVEFKRVEDGQP